MVDKALLERLRTIAPQPDASSPRARNMVSLAWGAAGGPVAAKIPARTLPLG